MDTTGTLLARANELYNTYSAEELYAAHQLHARSGGMGGDPSSRPGSYKIIGIVLAIASGVFIGVSFVIKKQGLLQANEKYNEEAGEGYSYLKNVWWWFGMTLMILGEVREPDAASHTAKTNRISRYATWSRTLSPMPFWSRPWVLCP